MVYFHKGQCVSDSFEFNKFKQILNKIDPISLIHFPGLSVQIK